MTNIIVSKTSANNIFKVEISGHSGYADLGSDIVCSAISALSQSALNGLIVLLKLEVRHTIKKGDLCFELQREDELSQEQQQGAQLILQTMLLGLLSIENSFPENLKIIERRN